MRSCKAFTLALLWLCPSFAVAETPVSSLSESRLLAADNESESVARVLDRLGLAAEGPDESNAMQFEFEGQFRYTANLRGEPIEGEEDFAHGFSIRRLRGQVRGHVGSDRVRYRLRAAFSSDGSLSFEYAMISIVIDDRTVLDLGQFRGALLHEERVGGLLQLAAGRSRLSGIFGQGFTQGVRVVHTRDRVRAFLEFTDGLDQSDTDFVNPGEADFAVTLRVDTRLGDAPWKDYASYISFPEAPAGVLLGIAGHFETAGETGFSEADRDLTVVTADATVLGGGWSAHAAGVWRRTDLAGMPTIDDFGVLAQGSVFVEEQIELFARVDTIWPGGDREGGADPFTTLTVGGNYFPIPRSHAIRLVADVQYLLDDFEGSSSLIGRSTNGAQLPDADDGQIALRIQIQFRM